MAVTPRDVEDVLRRHGVPLSRLQMTRDQWDRVALARVLVGSSVVIQRLDVIAHLSATDRLAQLDAALCAAKGAA